MTKLDTLKTDLNNLKTALTAALTAFNEAHPHACPECQGKGGVVKTYPATYWEPGESEWEGCPDCFERGLNPLDLNSEMSEEEAEDWVGYAYEGKYPTSPALQEVVNLKDNIYHLSDLMYEEENPDR